MDLQKSRSVYLKLPKSFFSSKYMKWASCTFQQRIWSAPRNHNLHQVNLINLNTRSQIAPFKRSHGFKEHLGAYYAYTLSTIMGE